jgi:hypothetical protein
VDPGEGRDCPPWGRAAAPTPSTTGLFGRAPTPAPQAAPAGALPNSVNCTGSRCGAGAGAPRGFQRGGGAMFWWLHLAPTRNPPEELFCQTFFKTTQLHQRSHSTRGARAGAVFEEPESCQTGPTSLGVPQQQPPSPTAAAPPQPLNRQRWALLGSSTPAPSSDYSYSSVAQGRRFVVM